MGIVGASSIVKRGPSVPPPTVTITPVSDLAFIEDVALAGAVSGEYDSIQWNVYDPETGADVAAAVLDDRTILAPTLSPTKGGVWTVELVASGDAGSSRAVSTILICAPGVDAYFFDLTGYPAHDFDTTPALDLGPFSLTLDSGDGLGTCELVNGTGIRVYEANRVFYIEQVDVDASATEYDEWVLMIKYSIIGSLGVDANFELGRQNASETWRMSSYIRKGTNRREIRYDYGGSSSYSAVSSSPLIFPNVSAIRCAGALEVETRHEEGHSGSIEGTSFNDLTVLDDLKGAAGVFTNNGSSLVNLSGARQYGADSHLFFGFRLNSGAGTGFILTELKLIHVRNRNRDL